MTATIYQPSRDRAARHHVSVGDRLDVEMTLSPGEFCAAVCCLQHRVATAADAMARMLAAKLLGAVGHHAARPVRYLSAWLDGPVNVRLSGALARVLARAVRGYHAAVPDSPLLRLAARVLCACDPAAPDAAADTPPALPDAFPMLDRFALAHTRVTGRYSDRVSLAVADELSQRRAGGHPTAHLDLLIHAPKRPIYEVSALAALAHYPSRVQPEYTLLYRGRELDAAAAATAAAARRDGRHDFEAHWASSDRLGYPLASPEQISPWEIADLTRAATRHLAPEHALPTPAAMPASVHVALAA